MIKPSKNLYQLKKDLITEFYAHRDSVNNIIGQNEEMISIYREQKANYRAKICAYSEELDRIDLEISDPKNQNPEYISTQLKSMQSKMEWYEKAIKDCKVSMDECSDRIDKCVSKIRDLDNYRLKIQRSFNYDKKMIRIYEDCENLKNNLVYSTKKVTSAAKGVFSTVINGAKAFAKRGISVFQKIQDSSRDSFLDGLRAFDEFANKTGDVIIKGMDRAEETVKNVLAEGARAIEAPVKTAAHFVVGSTVMIGNKVKSFAEEATRIGKETMEGPDLEDR